ncbi:TetR/AcrR family transcriptional regulator [Chryseobacterium sp. ISL-6]|uniref:TetR/AcrR family transcriptional regulator n=1 Tax=Chryseobacterium sp. ISL-6 TaxID=2819143 RepID=UPI001BE57A28|nr:TetR/AcrR family transcriptional regulator [Chryseobacterium sp. ISL-6]MBT2623018.1 TetR/AcrR family transcriptional regulator [Chryseobacterium sp. ISL-6]
MKTKEKIISTALRLFNEKGYNNITTRHIAAELNISPGNLHYHFKHSEDIIKVIFSELIIEMDKMMNNLNEAEVKTLESLFDFTFHTYEIFYSYRFIFLNFVDILKKIPQIEAQYEKITMGRKNEFQTIFSDFQKNKIFQENLPDFIIENLSTQIFIIADNWVTHNSITLKLPKDEAIKHYSLIQMNLFYPLLNPEQQELYKLNYINK